MTEGARRQCRLALTRKNTETNDELQLALFSSNDWSEESRQVTWVADQGNLQGLSPTRCRAPDFGPLDVTPMRSATGRRSPWDDGRRPGGPRRPATGHAHIDDDARHPAFRWDDYAERHWGLAIPAGRVSGLMRRVCGQRPMTASIRVSDWRNLVDGVGRTGRRYGLTEAYPPEVRASCNSQHHPETRCQRHAHGGLGDGEPVSRR